MCVQIAFFCFSFLLGRSCDAEYYKSIDIKKDDIYNGDSVYMNHYDVLNQDMEESCEHLPVNPSIFSHNEVPLKEVFVQYENNFVGGMPRISIPKMSIPKMKIPKFKAPKKSVKSTGPHGKRGSHSKKQTSRRKHEEDGDGETGASDTDDEAYYDHGSTTRPVFWVGAVIVVVGGAATAYKTGLCNIM